MTIRVLGLSLYGPQAASHRVRLSQFKPGLAAAGIDLHIQSLLDNNYLQRSFSGQRLSLRDLFAAYVRRIYALNNAYQFDLAIVYGDLLPFLPWWFEKRLLKIPFIYDFDDAFYLKYRNARLPMSSLAGKIDKTISHALAVTAGNIGLAVYAQQFNGNVSILPSVVDTVKYKLASFPSVSSLRGPFTIGWIGSPSTAPFLQILVEPLQRLACERPLRLMLVGGSAPAIKGVEVIEHPWHLEHEVTLIQKFDVGVMPLPNTPWTRGKCAYKLIQCMACGIPVVASAVGTNVDAVPSECGLLADSPEDWLDALQRLAANPELRQQMGLSARRWVEEHYSLRSALPILKNVIHSADVH